jgi:quercetin dioxygenase-like cupin family protein
MSAAEPHIERSDYGFEDPEGFLVKAKALLEDKTKVFESLSPEKHCPDDHKDITIHKVSVQKEGEWFLSKVVQPAGAVIEPHRHPDTHVLVEVISGKFWIECEGYGRILNSKERFFFPAGFSHTVIALQNGENDGASFWSIHHFKELPANQAQFLGNWPSDKANGECKLPSELAVCHWLLKCFLLMNPKALDASPTLKGWFYLIHYDRSGFFEPTDEDKQKAIGFVGTWSDCERDVVHRSYRPPPEEKEKVFRHGRLLRSPVVASARIYPWLFVASANESRLEELVAFSELHAVQDSTGTSWKLSKPRELEAQLAQDKSDASCKTLSALLETPFEDYMRLVCCAFLKPTEIFLVVTPPQQPGNTKFVERVQRVPSSSIVIGVNEFDKAHVASLIPFCLLVLSVLQQARFAVTDDLTDIRLDLPKDELRHGGDVRLAGRRTSYFADVVLEQLLSASLSMPPAESENDADTGGLLKPLLIGHGRSQERAQIEPLLAALTHTLSDEKLQNLAENVGEWQAIAQSAYDEALLGGELLSDARDLFSRGADKNEREIASIKKCVLNGREKLWEIRRNSRLFIRRLCQDHTKGTIFGKSENAFSFCWGNVDFYGKPLSEHLFDRADLIFAIGALRSNAEKHKAQFQLFYEEYQDGTSYFQVVHWLQNGEIPWSDKSALIKAIQESAKHIEKGINRGLPKVLLFAIENQCHELSVKLKSEEDWISLIEPKTHESQMGKDSKLFQAHYKNVNYGWRFVFKGQVKPASKLGTQGERPSVAKLLLPRALKVFLLDDLEFAGKGWFQYVADALRQDLSGVDFQIQPLPPPSPGQNGNAIVEFFFNQIKAQAPNEIFSIVTDSNFAGFPDGGAQLVRRLLNDATLKDRLHRAAIFSDDPMDTQKESSRVCVAGKIELCPKTGLLVEDAKAVSRFIATGELKPLSALLEMIHRLCAAGDFLLRTDKPPQPEIIQRAAEALIRGGGGGLPLPFSLSWFGVFNPKVLNYEIERKAGNTNDRDKAMIVRPILCPAASIASARALLRALRDKSNSSDVQGGALRLLWEIGLFTSETILLKQADSKLDSDARERFNQEHKLLRVGFEEMANWDSSVWDGLWVRTQEEMRKLKLLGTLLSYA